MQNILIADENLESRVLLTELCSEAGYKVTVGTSIAGVLNGIIKKTARVVLLGSSFDELTAQDLIPLFKKCCTNLDIIVVSSEITPPVTRKLRKEGIFYHLLKPVLPEDKEEFRQVVACALNQPKHSYCW
ncbi:MAG: response regulator [Trichlorobacter sp.]|jgi:DNA-binding NtrC family response regulator|nr:response regulator [Trichlorobacter sp.]